MNKKLKKLYGLVLAGGRSKRMSKDKSLIDYRGKSQTQYCYDLLSRYCKNVFISNRADQKSLKEHCRFPQIHDVYDDIGPLGGILSAMTAFPEYTWLVLACDLPFVNGEVISYLIKERNATKLATAYRSIYDDLPEPLCAIYEPSGLNFLKRKYKENIVCPRKILLSADIALIDQTVHGLLDNVNSPQDYEKAISRIKIRE